MRIVPVSARFTHPFTVFLDRDGTLNRDTGYITSPSDLVLFDGVVEAMARLKRAGSALVLVTNQSAIGRGLMTETDLEAIHRRLGAALSAGGGELDGVFFCPHRPDAGCRCRKPAIGLVEQAVAKLGVDARHSYMVGDKSMDMELARNVGAVGVLVTTSDYSHEAVRAVRMGQLDVGTIASSLAEAVEWILRDARHRGWSERVTISRSGRRPRHAR